MNLKIDRKANLPTLISKLPNLNAKSGCRLLTMYTSETGSTCPRSTLHQGSTTRGVCVQDPSVYVVSLLPSTPRLLKPYQAVPF